MCSAIDDLAAAQGLEDGEAVASEASARATFRRMRRKRSSIMFLRVRGAGGVW